MKYLLLLILVTQASILLLATSCTRESEIDRHFKLLPFRKGTEAKWGYIDTTGKIILEPQYNFAYDFSDSLAFVMNDKNKAGFITQNGRWAIKWSSEYKERIMGLPLQNHDCYTFSEGKVVFYGKNGKFGYSNKENKVICQPQFDFAFHFSEGMGRVCKGSILKYGILQGGKWGFVDTNGIIKIALEFDNALDFFEELAAVKKNDKWGYIDKKGNWVISPQFEEANSFMYNRAIVKVGSANHSKYGFIDKSGKYIIQPNFDLAHSFSDSLAGVLIDEKWGYINISGELIIGPKFDEIYSFSEGIAPVKVDGKIGFINNEGAFILHPKYDYAEFGSFSSRYGGLGLVRIGSKELYIDKKGQFIFERDSGLEVHDEILK